MEHLLRCNDLKCRKELDDRAVVTTCSHVFCIPCAESSHLANPNGSTRLCPACDTHLSNPDDAVVTQLHPTEDYKTSVLSGLGPTIIMECAARALSFYSYQTEQEILYQAFLAKSLTEKYSSLSSHMDKVINDANAQVASLRDQLSSIRLEKQQLEQKNQGLAQKCQEKSKKHQQLHVLYTRLKQQQLAAGMEVAADTDAENVLQGAATGAYNMPNHRGDQPLRSRAGSHGSGGNGGPRVNANAWDNRATNNHGGVQSSRSAPVPMTPSGHRERLPPASLYGNRGANNAGADAFRQGTPLRQTFNSLDPNVYGNSNYPGYAGMSAGVKVGRSSHGPIGHGGVGVSRMNGGGGFNMR